MTTKKEASTKYNWHNYDSHFVKIVIGEWNNSDSPYHLNLLSGVYLFCINLWDKCSATEQKDSMDKMIIAGLIEK